MSTTTEVNLGPLIVSLIGAVTGITFGVTARDPIGRANDSYGAVALCFLALTPLLLGVLTVALATRKQRESNPYVILMPWLAATICCGLAVTFAFGFLYSICFIAPYTLITASLGGIAAKIIWHHSSESETESEL